MQAALRQLVLTILLGSVLAACGGGGGGSSAPTTPSPVPVPPPQPAPVVPPEPYAIPTGMWRPASALLPASGNFIYTESDKDDWIGGGQSYTYTDTNALLTVMASGIGVKLYVKAVERWSGVIVLPNTLPALQVGYFKDVSQVSNNPAGGVLDWGGEGRGCAAKGWVVIDKVTIANNIVTELDLRFEQRCGISAAATRAYVHWTLANANALVPASPSPIPPEAWRADPSLLPESGTYVYLSGIQDANNNVRDRLYTRSTAVMWLSGYEGRMNLDIKGDQKWQVEFSTMDALKRLQVGYYPNLKYHDRHNPLVGGLVMRGESPPCYGMAGWAVIDAVTYTGNDVTSLDMRFEQTCNGLNPQRGQIRWRAGETPVVVGPVNPPPAGLWKVPVSVVTPAGNYIYLSSETGFYLTPFRKALPLDTFIHMNQLSTPAQEGIIARVDGYDVMFVAVEGMAQITPGYYSGLQAMHLRNPMRGGFELSGNGTTCYHGALSWVVIEQATYSQRDLTSIDLRFQMTCETTREVMHGAIHWVKPPVTPN